MAASSRGAAPRISRPGLPEWLATQSVRFRGGPNSSSPGTLGRNRFKRANCTRIFGAGTMLRRQWSRTSALITSKPSPLTSKPKGRPQSKAKSLMTRWQKPWMVNTLARSRSITAGSRRRPTSAAGMSREAQCAMRSRAWSEGPPTPAAALWTARNVRRSLSRSSSVAATVNVTISKSPISRCASTMSRAASVVRAYVLPVPALASMSVAPVPSKGKLNGVIVVGAVMSAACAPPARGAS